MSKEQSPRIASVIFGPLARWIVSHRVAVILATVGVTAFLTTRIGNLKIDSDPDLWAPQDHPYVQTTNLLERVFGGRNVTVIGVVPRQGDIYQPAVLAKIQRMQAAIEQLPEAVRHNVLSLAARKVKQIKGGPQGLEARPMMETVPQTAADMDRLKSAVASMPIYINSLVSPDGRAAAVVADFKQDKTEPNFTAMLKGLRAIVAKEQDPSVDIYMGGLPVIGAWSEFHFMKMPMFFGIAMLIIMAIQLWSFRSLQGMLLPMLTGLLSVLWSLGLMGLLGVHMDPLNTTTPILIMAVAAGHAIQILKRYYEEFHRLQAAGVTAREANREAVIESMVRVGPVMFIAGVIAAITFFSLAKTGISMVQHFGVFAGCGVLSALTLEMTIIPALRAALRPQRAREAAREKAAGVLDRFLGALASRLVGGRAPWFVGGGLVLLAVVAAGGAFLRVDNNFKLYNKPNSEVRVHDRVLNEKFAGTNSLQFLVRTPERDGIKNPQVLQAMAKLQAFLETQPDVGKTQSLVDMVKRMNQAMNGDDRAAYTVPASADLVAQYLFLYSLSGDPQDFDSFVDNDYQQAAIWTYLKNDSTAYADSLAHKAQAIIAANFPPGVTVQMGGSLPQVIALNEVVVKDKVRNMVQMALVVLVLSALILRSLVGGFFVIAPLIAVMLANFGLMGWMNVPLDISAVTSAAMAIGIGADYEIYLLFRFREELERTGDVLAATRNSLLTSGKAIVFVALSVAAGYAVLQTSGFAFYNQLSTMVMATMLVSVLFALFFLRALMMIFKPRFVFGARRDQLFAEARLAQGGRS